MSKSPKNSPKPSQNKSSKEYLIIAQDGGKHKDAKPLKGYAGANILEIVLDDGNGTYRTMYTIEFEEVVYVLHAFQKKSKTGLKLQNRI